MLKQFVANIRRKLLNRRVNREIFDKIFSQINGEANHGYPFSSKDEMTALHIHSGLDAQVKFNMIELVAADMPEAYGDAFRYIVYRDLNERMKMYLEIAAERTQPKTCDPRLVATHA